MSPWKIHRQLNAWGHGDRSWHLHESVVDGGVGPSTWPWSPPGAEHKADLSLRRAWKRNTWFGNECYPCDYPKQDWSFEPWAWTLRIDSTAHIGRCKSTSYPQPMEWEVQQKTDTPSCEDWHLPELGCSFRAGRNFGEFLYAPDGTKMFLRRLQEGWFDRYRLMRLPWRAFPLALTLTEQTELFLLTPSSLRSTYTQTLNTET